MYSGSLRIPHARSSCNNNNSLNEYAAKIGRGSRLEGEHPAPSDLKFCNRDSEFAVSENGTLAFLPTSFIRTEQKLVSIDRKGKTQTLCDMVAGTSTGEKWGVALTARPRPALLPHPRASASTALKICVRPASPEDQSHAVATTSQTWPSANPISSRLGDTVREFATTPAAATGT